MPGKEKRSKLLWLIPRTWRRSRPAVPRTRSLATSCTMMPLINLRRSRSMPDANFSSDSDWDDMAPGAVAPDGYFAVYVGPDRARFVIKTESVNHPLFRMLLEDAEKEYGFDIAGPLTLPCEVSVFRSILHSLNSTDYDSLNSSTDYEGDLDDSLHRVDSHMGLLGRRPLCILSA